MPPDTFMGDGYVLASGATDITGVDLFPVNLTNFNFTGLELSVSIWGTVNIGTVNASTPAFSNFLGSYSTFVTGAYQSGKLVPFEGTPIGTAPSFTFSNPLQLNGASTIGISFYFEGTTNRTAYHLVNSLTSLISFGVAPTTGSDVFNGFYRNANSEINGNFTSSLKGFSLAGQSVAVRIFGDIDATPNQWMPGTGDWSVASDWSTYSVPTSSTIATFDLSSPNYTIAIPVAGTCNGLSVQSDTVTLDMSAASSALTIANSLTVGQPVTAGTAVKGVLSLTHSYGGPVANISAGAVAVGGEGGIGTLTIGNGVTLVSTDAFSVAAGSSTVIAPGGKLVAPSLVIAGTSNAWTGLIDLGTGALDLPLASISTVTNQIKQGYNGGYWNGTGGITSSSAANDASHLTAVGVVINDTVANTGNASNVALYTSFEGTTSADGDILVKCTYYGDANLDGKIDGSDYSLIDNGFIHHLTGWYNGDLNYDGVVNGSDYTLIDNAFDNQGASLTTSVAESTSALSGASPVPEPSVSILGAFAAWLLSRRRRWIC